MTTPMRVKICGITTPEDAALAVRFGADAVGVLVGLLYASEDELEPKRAGEILATLPPFVAGTLVTHRSELADVRDLCRDVKPQVVQLHGPFPVEQIPALRELFPWVRIIKAIHVDGDGALEAARKAAVRRCRSARHEDGHSHRRYRRHA